MYFIFVILMDITIMMIPNLENETAMWIAISANFLVTAIKFIIDTAVEKLKNITIKEPITSVMANTAMNNAMKKFIEERK